MKVNIELIGYGHTLGIAVSARVAVAIYKPLTARVETDVDRMYRCMLGWVARLSVSMPCHPGAWFQLDAEHMPERRIPAPSHPQALPGYVLLHEAFAQ
jgi:hypothetical protein